MWPEDFSDDDGQCGKEIVVAGALLLIGIISSCYYARKPIHMPHAARTLRPPARTRNVGPSKVEKTANQITIPAMNLQSDSTTYFESNGEKYKVTYDSNVTIERVSQ